MPALQTKKNLASKPVKDKVKDRERPRPTDIAGNEKTKSKNRSDEIDLTGPESERGHPSTSKTKSSIFIAGDSVVKDVRGWLLSRHKYVKVYSFSGADTTDMNDFIKPLLKKQPDEVILHIGTNNLASTLSPEQIVDEILKLRLIITSYGIKCAISTIVKHDDGFWQKACEVNQLLFSEIPTEQLIDNSELESLHLNGSRLLLNTAGSAKLASNFRNHIREHSL